MQKYFFKPRVGQNYWKGIGGLRVLIVGSHFRCPYSNCVHLKKECASSSTIFEMDQKCPCYLDKEDQEYYRLSNSDTIEVNSYLEGFSYQAFSAFTYLMLNKRDHLTDQEKSEFWEQVAFTNYIQHYWPDGSSPKYFENKALYDTDHEAFAQVVDELKPHLIFVWNEAIRDCLIANSNLTYFGKVDIPVLSVYLFLNYEAGTEINGKKESFLQRQYHIIPGKVTKGWIESLFNEYFNSPNAIELFGLKTIEERSASGMGVRQGVGRTPKIKDVASLFKQLVTRKILVRAGDRIVFGNGIMNNHKETFMRYLKQTFNVPKYTNGCMSRMFGYEFIHSKLSAAFEDDITRKMKAVFMMVDTRDKDHKIKRLGSSSKL